MRASKIIQKIKIIKIIKKIKKVRASPRSASLTGSSKRCKKIPQTRFLFSFKRKTEVDNNKTLSSEVDNKMIPPSRQGAKVWRICRAGSEEVGALLLSISLEGACLLVACLFVCLLLVVCCFFFVAVDVSGRCLLNTYLLLRFPD